MRVKSYFIYTIIFPYIYCNIFIFYRYLESDVIEGSVYAGKDRYNGEIVAFYISLILGLPRVPIVVKRILDSIELHDTSNFELKKTMYINCKL